ncbi:hypothetical protein EDB89DRAFT_1275708 [Lactarius sanguifluus]|nr:hypothetical protein EDB89DRAFT_1275708 [Lactarius sanguifluus]
MTVRKYPIPLGQLSLLSRSPWSLNRLGAIYVITVFWYDRIFSVLAVFVPGAHRLVLLQPRATGTINHFVRLRRPAPLHPSEVRRKVRGGKRRRSQRGSASRILETNFCCLRAASESPTPRCFRSVLHQNCDDEIPYLPTHCTTAGTPHDDAKRTLGRHPESSIRKRHAWKR